MQYSELNITHHQNALQTEILIALLAELGFDSFVDDPNLLLAYIPTESIKQTTIRELLQTYPNIDRFLLKDIREQNWNAVWESNYEPVRFGNFCNIRAPFHPPALDVKFDLIIEPKMSFGTAHHETTALMIEWLKTTMLSGKRVLDMGCGTGVLAILAKKLGAEYVEAIDIDNWAFENTKENIIRNQTPEIVVKLGNADTLTKKHFDVVIANINRNILIRDMGKYAQTLSKDGIILLSGFYKSDLNAIQESCVSYNLIYDSTIEKNHWVAAKFIKL